MHEENPKIEVQQEMSQIVAVPVIYPRDSTVLGYGDNGITVRISCADRQAVIRYTDDGKEPTGSSSVFPEMGRTYSPVLHPIVIKAKAFKQGFQESRTATANLYVKVRPPKFEPLPSPSPIVMPEGQLVEITVSGFPAGASVLVDATTDGREPRREAAVASPKMLLLTSNAVVKAKCFAEGCYDSDTVVKSYSFKPSTPTINGSAPSSTFQQSLSVSIECPTPGATVQYTLDGSDPINSITRINYRGPFTLTKATVVKARASKANMNISDLAIRTFQRIDSGMGTQFRPT
jgi:hypothetical protein